MEMDQRNKIMTFEELGLFDPFNTENTFEDAQSEVQRYDFFDLVYD